MATTASGSLNRSPCLLALLCIFQTLNCIPLLTPRPPGLFAWSDLFPGLLTSLFPWMPLQLNPFYYQVHMLPLVLLQEPKSLVFLTFWQPFGDLKIMIFWKGGSKGVLTSNRMRFESWLYYLLIVQITKPHSALISLPARWKWCPTFRVVVSMGSDNVCDSFQPSDYHIAGYSINVIFLSAFFFFLGFCLLRINDCYLPPASFLPSQMLFLCYNTHFFKLIYKIG